MRDTWILLGENRAFTTRCTNPATMIPGSATTASGGDTITNVKVRAHFGSFISAKISPPEAFFNESRR